MNVSQLRGGISCQCFMTLMQEVSTIKEIYLDSKINSIIYPHLKCIKCYMNNSHLSIFKFSSSGTVLGPEGPGPPFLGRKVTF